LTSSANSVVVGNATVADVVTVHDARTLLVTGKAFGSTNLTVLDRAGNTIYSSQLVVGGEDDAGLTIVRGGAHLLVLLRRQMPRHPDGRRCSRAHFSGRHGHRHRQASRPPQGSPLSRFRSPTKLTACHPGSTQALSGTHSASTTVSEWFPALRPHPERVEGRCGRDGRCLKI
jgi:hypothetical protein